MNPVGRCALVARPGTRRLQLFGPRGPLREWHVERGAGEPIAATLEDPARLAVSLPSSSHEEGGLGGGRRGNRRHHGAPSVRPPTPRASRATERSS